MYHPMIVRPFPIPPHLRRSSFEENESSQKLLSGFQPGNYDVALGRGCTTYNLTGNHRFRVTISLYLDRYLEASTRLEKFHIIDTIIHTIHKAGGKFVKQACKGDNLWYEVSQDLAKQKVGHALRDAHQRRRREVQKQRSLQQGQASPRDSESGGRRNTKNGKGGHRKQPTAANDLLDTRLEMDQVSHVNGSVDKRIDDGRMPETTPDLDAALVNAGVPSPDRVLTPTSSSNVTDDKQGIVLHLPEGIASASTATNAKKRNNGVESTRPRSPPVMDAPITSRTANHRSRSLDSDSSGYESSSSSIATDLLEGIEELSSTMGFHDEDPGPLFDEENAQTTLGSLPSVVGDLEGAQGTYFFIFDESVQV